MKKIAIILTVALVITSLVTVFPVGALSSDIFDGTATSSWYDENAETLIIDSAEDLYAFVLSVNKGNVFSGKTVELACDIVWGVGNASKWSATNAPAKTWTPIGTAAYPFNGTFDGNGYTVSGLYCYSAYTGSQSTDGVGFFGNVDGATIKDLHIRNSYFNAPMIVGSAVGKATGGLTISGCSSSATVVCNFPGPSGYDSYYGIGGLVGCVYGSSYPAVISSCAYAGSVVADTVTVGGLVGYLNGSTASVSGCKVDAEVSGRNRVGGLVGRAYTDTTITECYANSEIFMWGTLNYGGILGSLRTAGKTVEITDCYYSGQVYKPMEDAIYGQAEELPTRLGSNEYDSSTVYGSISTSSTYYTDSTNDNSYATSGNQAALPSEILCQGGFDAWRTKVNSTSGGLTAAANGNVSVNDIYYVHESINVIGASVRLKSPAGIRFTTEVEKDQFFKENYNGDPANYKYDGANITFGTLIIPLDMLDGEFDVNTSGAVNITAKKILEQDEESLKYNAVIYDYPERTDTYNRTLAVRSYIKYGDEYIYSDIASTSFYDVAQMAYSAEGQATKEGLNLLMALGSVSDDFYAENPQRVLKLDYATPELFSDLAKALEAEGYTKHTNYEYSDNCFGVYYNADYTVTFYYTPKTIGEYTDNDQSKWYADGSFNDDWDVINQYVSIEDEENVMRVIVEKTSDTTLPAKSVENSYERLEGQKNTLAYMFPTDSYNKNEMGYVIQLADGSFILIDSGYDTTDPRTTSDTSTESDYIYNYLMSKKPASHDKPIIAAWILTHQHGDHVDAFKGFLAKYASGVELEQVIYNFMESEYVKPYANSASDPSFADQYITPYCPDAKIITAHTGYKFYIRNAQLNILYSIDDFAPNKVPVFSNNESIVFDVIIDGGQRLMFTGDMFLPASRALVNMYGEDLKSDVIQIAHHGNFGATEEVNRLIWPDSQDYTSELKFALLPNPKVHQSEERLENPENTYLKGVVEADGANWLDKLYAVYEILFDSELMGSDVFTNNSSFTTTKEKNNSYKGNGKWKTVELYTTSDVLVSYTVEHVVEGTVKASEVYNGVASGSLALPVEQGSLDAKTYVGYKFDSVEDGIKVGDIVATGTVITINYVKDESQTKSIKYTVNHVVGNNIISTNEVTATVWVNDTSTKIAVTAESILSREGEGALEGYIFASISPKISAGSMVERDTVITISYIIDEDNDKDWIDSWN